MNKTLIAILVLICVNYASAHGRHHHGCHCDPKPGFEPWAALCQLNDNCYRQSSCGDYSQICEWDGYPRCRCRVNDGQEAFEAFCANGCNDEDYCRADGRPYCTWRTYSSSCQCQLKNSWAVISTQYNAFCSPFCDSSSGCQSGAAAVYCDWVDS